MTKSDADAPREDHPATWENELVGRAKQALGKALGDDELVEQGEEQREIAHEVHDDAKDERAD